ncbi:hypothetical protein RDn1_228 [Candidatus Termititenax dinenymphae]|uniref:N-acetyltransferase domain-containing protein n=1 Tax=Candidatus Termititenax dinenymphae TaxID=2218523 RepID=A0A388TJW1_9BACT|nr:hypothetical protein RDn1_228 [Candidatus Termititenax dinenymphae]
MADIGIKVFIDNPPVELTAYLEPEIPAKTYVLYDQRWIIGWAQILTHPTGEYELAYLQVVPEYRGKGYARDLVLFALYEYEVDQIYAMTVIPDFYTKLGFKYVELPSFVDYTNLGCQSCDIPKCKALIFNKPTDLIRYGAEQKYFQKYKELISGRNFMGSELSYVNELTWTYAENIYLLDLDGYLFLVAYPYADAPFSVICPYQSIPDAVLDKYFARLRELNIKRLKYLGTTARLILEGYSGKAELKIQEDRDNFDYLYKVKDFAEFPGADFASKRNRLKKFLRSNSGGEIIQYKPELKEDFFNFARQKFTEMDVDVISEEVLRLGLEQDLYQGFMVRIGKMDIGLLLYSELNPKTVIVHFELIDESYDGVAQFMNNHLGQMLTGKYLFINREQDLGIPGLRKSKLSYNPYRLIRKYGVEI